MDLGDLRLVQADRDELDQPVIIADHAECAVAGLDQWDRSLHDLAEHDLQVELATDGDDGFQQGMNPVTGGHHRPEPGLQLGEQVVEPELGQDGAGLWFHRRLSSVAGQGMYHSP
jgi:hypothetical protein